MQDDPSISAAIASIVESSLNFALCYDPATRKKLAGLDGTVIEIACSSPEVHFYIVIHGNEIQVASYYESDADVCISGSAIDFLRLMGDSTPSLADSSISVSGRVSALNQIKTILSDLEIDWEDMLSEILGVVPANLISQSTRTSFEWLKKQKRDFEQNLPEYLSEELQAVPSKTELEFFYQDVEELNSSVQRAEARLQRIKEQIEKADARD